MLLLKNTHYASWLIKSEHTYVCTCAATDMTNCKLGVIAVATYRTWDNYNAALNYKKSAHWDHRLLIRVAFIKDLSGFPVCCELAFRFLYIHLHKTLKSIDSGFPNKTFQISELLYAQLRKNSSKSSLAKHSWFLP